MHDNSFPKKGFVRAKTILAHLPISEVTLYAWIKKGKFPKPIKLGARTSVWEAEVVRKWIQERAN